MGFSMAVFVLILVGAVLVNRESLPRRRSSRLIIALLAGALLETAIETGPTNALVLLILVFALAGDTFFQRTESPWGRWLSQGIALVGAPERPFWLTGVFLDSAYREGLGWAGRLIGGCLLAVPALVLALLFGSLLAWGNAVFGSWTGSLFDWVWRELILCFNLERIISWFMAALLALPLLRPANIPDNWWKWTEQLPRLPEVVPSRAAIWASGLVLIVLNILFLAANSADALFLWNGETLPTGVTYSGFVHEGVNVLLATVLLAALVLTVIFQQNLKVARRRELKWFGLIWIAQNLFLLLSVALRLKLYIEAYDMTVLRLSVMIFLLLVALGYGLLALKIVQDRSLSWLIGGCILAVFATFYVTQFLDLAGSSANYNVERWKKDRSRNLDISYIYSLGPDGWPALRHVRKVDPSNPLWSTYENMAHCDEVRASRSKFDRTNWREFSLRAWINSGALEEKANN